MKKLIIFSLLLFAAAMVYGQQPKTYQNPETAMLIPLEKENRMVSTEALQATLNELISQRHAVQQAHWNVKGPLFYALHDLLGDFYEMLDAKIDVVAERKVILGAPADGRVGSVAQSVDLPELPQGFIDDQQVLEVLTTRYKTLSDRLYNRIEATENDPPTQDLIIELTTMIDKHLWMLRSFQE